MPLTSGHSLPYPTLGSAPNIPADLAALAEAADTALTGVAATAAATAAALDGRLDAVEAVVTTTGKQAYSVAADTLAAYTSEVGFGHTYANPPIVMATAIVSSSSQHVSVSVYAVTTTGFKFTVRNWSPSTAQTGPLQWVAIGT